MAKKKRKVPPPPTNWKIPGTLVFRMFVLGSVAIGACCWGIYRYYFVPRMPMVVPAPAATEIPVPELEPLPAPSSSP